VSRPGPRTPLSLLCPRLHGTTHSAIVAELSATLGSLDRAWQRLDRQRDRERTARKAAAQARRLQVAGSFAAAAATTAAGAAFRQWAASPLEIPPWALRGQAEGWPEPESDPNAPTCCPACQRLFGPSAAQHRRGAAA
jgi:hypothetical protein